MEKITGGVVVELGTKILKPEEMRIEPSSSNLVAAGFWNACLPIAGQDGTEQHN